MNLFAAFTRGSIQLTLSFTGNRPEHFWGTLKSELVHHQKFKTRLQAKEEISEYIEIFYNRQRKQKRLGYLSPAEFKQRYYAEWHVTGIMASCAMVYNRTKPDT